MSNTVQTAILPWSWIHCSVLKPAAFQHLHQSTLLAGPRLQSQTTFLSSVLTTKASLSLYDRQVAFMFCHPNQYRPVAHIITWPHSDSGLPETTCVASLPVSYIITWPHSHCGLPETICIAYLHSLYGCLQPCFHFIQFQ